MSNFSHSAMAFSEQYDLAQADELLTEKSEQKGYEILFALNWFH
jgi:hypothetical protein